MADHNATDCVSCADDARLPFCPALNCLDCCECDAVAHATTIELTGERDAAVRALAESQAERDRLAAEREQWKADRLKYNRDLRADNDRLCAQVTALRRALELCRDALDRLMGDTDPDDADGLEVRAMQAAARALDSAGGEP